MKPAVSAFRDQVCTVARWFGAWNSCEQTIALYSLLCQISATQARFFSLVLEHRFKHEPSQTDALEQEANDSDFIVRLSAEPREAAVSGLLAHLPLLHPGNAKTLQQYLILLKALLQDATERGNQLDECRQLLSLALVHPAFPSSERAALRWWLNKLDDRAVAGEYSWVPNHTSPSPSPSPSFVEDSRGDFEGRVGSPAPWPSNRQENVHFALHPAQPSSMDKYNRVGRSRSLQDSGVDPQPELIVRSHSLPPPPSSPPLSESPLSGKRNSVFSDQGSGMKDVPLWLKSLRLHKYQELFAEMTYDEMLSLTDVKLQEKGVTRGARDKILSSIQKLLCRPEMLARLEMDLQSPGKLLPAIHELRHMLCTPIRPYSHPEPGSFVDNSINFNGNSSLSNRCEQRPSSGSCQDYRSLSNKERNDSGIGVSWQSVDSVDNSILAGPGQEIYAADEAQLRTAPSSSVYRTSSSVLRSGREQVGVGGINPLDIPGRITEVIAKACTHLVSSGADEETCTTFLALLDKAICHEAFTVEQKKRFFSLKNHCQKATRQAQRKALKDSVQLYAWHTMPGSLPPSTYSQQSSLAASTRLPSIAARSLTTGATRRLERQDARSFSGPSANPYGAPGAERNARQQVPADCHRKSLHADSEAEERESFADLPGCQSSDADHYMMNLCLSMTEHALAGGDHDSQ